MQLRKTLGKYNPFNVNGEWKKKVADLNDSLAQANRTINQLTDELNDKQRQLDQSERIKREYFGLIVDIEKQRDEWCEMFKVQANEHLEGQNMLVNALEKARQVNVKFQKALHALAKRYQPGSELVDILPDRKSPPFKQAEKYKMAMQALEKLASDPIDGAKERAKIAASDHREA